MQSETALRRSKREHQPSAKAAASSASASLPPASSSASRRSQRRRVNLSASPVSTPTSTRNSSPVRGPVASPASSDLVSVVVDAVGPNGQRRRVRAAAHTGSNSNVTQGVLSSHPNGGHDDGKVLGRYSSHTCALLCEVILVQLKKQTLAPTVLDESKSPAFIKWEPVSRKMETTHMLRMTPRECQLLWKFLAYGEISVVETDKEDELLPDSDEEDFHKTPAEINAQVAAKSAKVTAATEQTTENDNKQVGTGDAAEKTKEQEKSQRDGTPEQIHSSLRLYPTYSLPNGAPDAWYRPFGPKDALPLTFAASRFLRRKPTPPLQTLIGKPTADLKRNQAAPIPNAAAKKPKLTTPASTPPRVFTPSLTPPPAAKRARSEVEFFELRLREEHAKTTPQATFALSAADLQHRYNEASVDVRHQCQLLAVHDVERFNREVVRVRIWQKAMGAGNINPATPASKPVASPSQTKSSGPTAALLAHTAAVTAAVAKAKSSSASKPVQEQK